MPARPLARPFVAAALALVAGACQDAPTGPATTHSAETAGAAPNGQALACTVDVRAETLACNSAKPATAANTVAGPRRTLVLGGQGIYVNLTTSGSTHSGDTLTVPVAVQNLLSQPLATTDGVSYDGRGVTVFFAQLPTTTAGTGAVAVLNADTTGTYTAAGQPAFVYRQFLAGNQTTPEHDWRFAVPSTVLAFQFVVYVRAQLPDESVPVAQQPAHAFATGAAMGIVGGANHTCALRSGAGVYCWGSTTVPGDTGSLNASQSAVPLLVPGSAGAAALAPSAGSAHACWLTAAGAAACVGDNSSGQLGDGTTNFGLTARAVVMPGGVTAFSRLAVGGLHTCGLTSAGAAYCWGFNLVGELGDGTTDDHGTAAPVQMPAGVAFVAIAAGQVHTCGLAGDGSAYCWGDNSLGQLGTGATDALPATTPVAVRLPPGVALTSVAGGGAFTCGLTADGAAYCWGDNSSGQLGDGTTTGRVAPVRVLLPSGVALRQVVAGLTHACGRAGDGSVYCWGDDGSGQLGDGATAPRATPAAVALPPGVQAAQLSAGGSHGCALATTGAAYCWGLNAYGQLGDGTTADRGAPVAVRMP